MQNPRSGDWKECKWKKYILGKNVHKNKNLVQLALQWFIGIINHHLKHLQTSRRCLSLRKATKILRVSATYELDSMQFFCNSLLDLFPALHKKGACKIFPITATFFLNRYYCKQQLCSQILLNGIHSRKMHL